MNTEILTIPRPELKHPARGMSRVLGKVIHDRKKRTSVGFEEVKKEAHVRLQETKGASSDLHRALGNLAAEHFFKAFGIDVVTGIALAAWRRN